MDGSELVKKLQTSTKYFRSVLSDAGFTLKVTGIFLVYWTSVAATVVQIPIAKLTAKLLYLVNVLLV